MLAKVLFLFIQIGFLNHGFSQSIDSLIAVTNNKEDADTSKMRAYYLLAALHYNQDVDTTEYFVMQGMEIAEHNKNLSGLGEAYGWMAYLNAEKGNLKEAIDYNLKSLYVAKQLNLKSEFNTVLNNLAVLSMRLKNYDQALKYYEQCLALNLELENKPSLGTNYNNLGLVYRNKNDFEKALEYYKKAIDIRLELENEITLASTYSNLGSLYEVMDSTELALNYYQKSFVLNEKNKSNKSLAMVGSKLGNLYLQKGEQEKAFSYAEGAYNLADKWAYRYQKKEAAKVLYKVYKRKKKYEKSLAYFEIYANLNDSTHSLENQEKLIESKFQLAYNNKHIIDSLNNEKVVIKNQLLIQENKVKESRISVQRLGLLISVLCVVILSLIIFFIKKTAKVRMEKLRTEIRLKLAETITLRNELNTKNEKESLDLNMVLNDKLTSREQEILDELVLGLSNKEIGEKLFLSVNTIKTHILNLYDKLDVNNRTQAAVKGSMLKIQNKN